MHLHLGCSLNARLCAAALFLLGGSAWAAPLELSLRVEGPRPAAPVAATVVFRGLASSGHDGVPERELKVDLPGRTTVEMAAGPWEMTARANGYWSKGTKLLVEEKAAAEIVFFPSAQVRGTLAVPAGEAMPQEITLRFASAIGTSPRPFSESEMRCPVSEAGFTCEVPAGRLDLRMRARGFVSHYRWNAAVAPGTTFSFGALALQRGASVSGWVMTADGSPISPASRAHLVPRAAGLPASPGEHSRAEKSGLSSAVQHFEGVPPGQYVLTVEHPGFAPVRSYPVQVQENAETEIRKPLLLQPAAKVTVFFEIGPIPGVRELAAEGKSEIDGSWQRPGITPGRYALVVGNLHSMFENREVEVEAPETTVQVDLPLVWVEGKVQLGGEPLSSTLWFGGRNGAVRVRVLTDEEGKFLEALPREGEWPLDIEADEPRVVRRLRAVEVRRPDGKGTARLDIDLDDTHIAGNVIDDKGKPVAGAFVHVQRRADAELPATLVTDGKGAFQIAGLPPGRYNLEANSRQPSGVQAVSEVVTIDLAEDRELPETVLVLTENRVLEVRVTARGRGVPQARIQALPMLADGSATMWGRAVITDVNGLAKLDLPPRTASLGLLVLPPGFSLKMTRVPVGDGESLEIPVEPVGGTLIIELDGTKQPEGEDRPFIMVSREGVQANMGLLTSWAQVQGVSQEPGKLIVPSLEPGDYEA